MHKDILVIDDNPDIRFLICNILKEQNFNVRSAANYDQAVLEINKKLPDLAIVDIKLDKADKDGIDLLKLIISKNKLTPVIMISGHATVQIAVEAIRLGAYEFIEKPFSTEKILNYVKRALENASLKQEKDIIENKLFHSFELIGKSASIIKIKKTIEKLTTSESRILISGPTGSGKELVARKIHKNSGRSKEPFIILNAALLKEKTYEKELFGEEFDDGNISFGALERANKGTLLIDEVAEIPFETQANVLRVLIDQKFKRLNGSKYINVNIRLISSTSKNLKELVETEKEAVDTAKQYLSYFQGDLNNWKEPNVGELRNAIPENRLEVYDIHDVIELLADKNSILEIKGGFAKGMFTGFIRIEGKAVGVIANNPMYLAGAIDSDCADKASRFIKICENYRIPILSLCDTPGMMVGPEVEKTGLVRHCCRLFLAGANVSVPMMTIVLRKAYGLGAQAMAGGSFIAPQFVVGWPTAEIGAMGLEGAVKLGYRKELEAEKNIENREKLFKKLVDELYKKGKGLNAASLLEFDTVLDPAESRKWISMIVKNKKNKVVSHHKTGFIDAW